jgi:hypothetical protein
MKSLRKHRQRTGGTGGLQVFRCALKIFAIGQYRQTGGTMLFVALGDFGRVKIGTNDPF